MSPTSAQRIPSFEAVRGLAILAVVVIHGTAPIPVHPSTTVERFNVLFDLLWRPLLTFAVPTFYFISGYFLSRQRIESWADYKAFLGRRLSRILIPMGVWVVVGQGLLFLGVLTYHFLKHPQNPVNDCRELLDYLAAVSLAPNYFLIALTQFYILTPVYALINRTRMGPPLVIVLNLAYLTFLHPRWGPGMAFLAVPCTYYYLMGMYFGRRPPVDEGRYRTLILAAVGASVFLCALLGIARFLKGENLEVNTLSWQFSTAVYACSMIGLFLLLTQRNWAPAWLVRIGGYSFGIYLIHMLVTIPLTAFVRQIGWLSLLEPVYQGVVATATLVGCLLCIHLARRLLPERLCTRYLGF